MKAEYVFLLHSFFCNMHQNQTPDAWFKDYHLCAVCDQSLAKLPPFFCSRRRRSISYSLYLHPCWGYKKLIGQIWGKLERLSKIVRLWKKCRVGWICATFPTLHFPEAAYNLGRLVAQWKKIRDSLLIMRLVVWSCSAAAYTPHREGVKLALNITASHIPHAV